MRATLFSETLMEILIPVAVVVYVPFYAGLDISRHLWGYNISVRDDALLQLMDWLISRLEWEIDE